MFLICFVRRVFLARGCNGCVALKTHQLIIVDIGVASLMREASLVCSANDYAADGGSGMERSIGL